MSRFVFSCMCAFLIACSQSAEVKKRPLQLSGDSTPPNILYILGDQWRAQATGYSGDPNLQGKTPNLDRLAAQSVNFVNAVSGVPVCTPYRASLMTGQYPQTHGLFLNDLHLPDAAITIAEVLQDAGYRTGIIGKWHLDGRGRRSYIPANRRQGFEYWKVLECAHAYNNSYFYEDEDPKIQQWEGYDAFAQTRDAQEYIRARAKAREPFALFLFWGPPHDPYQFAPDKFRDMFSAEDIELRPNVRSENDQWLKKVPRDLAGYYAHVAALDTSVGDLMGTLEELGIEDNTIVVFTSDHGDMLGSQGHRGKQWPWDESIRVPFLIRYPGTHGAAGREVPTVLNSPDIMPTLLELTGVEAPASVEGRSFAEVVRGGDAPDKSATLIACISPFGASGRGKGGREYRGVRTERYTYVRDLEGPWLLFDNREDPYQLRNLVAVESQATLLSDLEKELQRLLDERDDAFLPAERYLEQWGHTVLFSGSVPFKNKIPQSAL